MSGSYYNEFDPYAAEWLRNLIAAGHLPAGDVDERSIVDVAPSDLAGYRQCHFFAGIGGWALAARLAGWPDDRELWTGSPPCQPFSVAGKGKAQADDRHLWPHLFRLVSACRPAVLMGEQVAAAVGKNWLDGVFADLEGIGYACGAAVVPACAVDAPHRRDRLWFVARADRAGFGAGRGCGLHREREARKFPSFADPGAVADAGGRGVRDGGRSASTGAPEAVSGEVREQRLRPDTRAAGDGGCGHVADSNGAGREQGRRHDQADGYGHSSAAACDAGSHWRPAGAIIGHDGKARRVEPGIRLLAHGVSGRVAVVRTDEQTGSEVSHWYNRSGALRAFGNAIVPQVAAEVIGAYMDCQP